MSKKHAESDQLPSAADRATLSRIPLSSATRLDVMLSASAKTWAHCLAEPKAPNEAL